MLDPASYASSSCISRRQRHLITALRVLGPASLAATTTPASAHRFAQLAFGPIGARIMAVVVALSTLGFSRESDPHVATRVLSDGRRQNVLRSNSAWVDPRTHVPVVAIVLQGTVAAVIALSGRYDQILNYVTSVDYSFFGLSAIALVIFRNRDARDFRTHPARISRMPGHPWTTVLFLAIAAWSIVGDVLIKSPVAIRRSA